MDWVNLEYPLTCWIVEVKYSGDISIAQCRCKEYPCDRETNYGFTSVFQTYKQASLEAKVISENLGIPFVYVEH